MNLKKYFTLAIISAASAFTVWAQNPVIRDQFSADPTARVINGKVYVFPSHDIPAPPNKNLRENWFCMPDYHVFSSENLSDWTDHGVIVSQNKVPWVDSTSYSMWAPDCIERNGKYYFYFPANKNVAGPNGRKGFGIGVAIADNPEGPYVPEENAIEGIFGIDPNVLIDKDGQAYLYYSMGNIYVAKLKENMTELATKPVAIANLPEKGMKEGPFVFERNGKYYLTFPHVENDTERLEYAIGDSPEGPFTMTGVIMDESETGCWTNHHSMIEYNNQWYLFYHHNDYSPHFDKNRSVCIDSLFFNADGTIQKVIPTKRGVGITAASGKIQLDRYSAISENGATIAFNDTTNTFAGWKTTLANKGAWVSYNKVKFEKKNTGKVVVNAGALNGGKIELRIDAVDGPVLAEISVPEGSEMTVSKTKISKVKPGIHNIFVVAANDNPVEIDWISFE
ncbi:family 43 glycosylhydrolase [uncultured Draconibacterium sp.]|uniref:family 43 glycosylhydrolase n=1 Tax=uncultured Draconibacterium sp. TaxID=1573823 RepID=UPI002AA80558|nr:family 43 glycosylhydrolase [uncultured Draconibacterium sp.]